MKICFTNENNIKHNYKDQCFPLSSKAKSYGCCHSLRQGWLVPLTLQATVTTHPAPRVYSTISSLPLLCQVLFILSFASFALILSYLSTLFMFPTNQFLIDSLCLYGSSSFTLQENLVAVPTSHISVSLQETRTGYAIPSISLLHKRKLTFSPFSYNRLPASHQLTFASTSPSLLKILPDFWPCQLSPPFSPLEFHIYRLS